MMRITAAIRLTAVALAVPIAVGALHIWTGVVHARPGRPDPWTLFMREGNRYVTHDFAIGGKQACLARAAEERAKRGSAFCKRGLHAVRAERATRQRMQAAPAREQRRLYEIAPNQFSTTPHLGRFFLR